MTRQRSDDESDGDPREFSLRRVRDAVRQRSNMYSAAHYNGFTFQGKVAVRPSVRCTRRGQRRRQPAGFWSVGRFGRFGFGFRRTEERATIRSALRSGSNKCERFYNVLLRLRGDVLNNSPSLFTFFFFEKYFTVKIVSTVRFYVCSTALLYRSWNYK